MGARAGEYHTLFGFVNKTHLESRPGSWVMLVFL